MRKNTLFRKESLEALNSPERLTEYLRVTNIPIWIILVAAFLLLVGFIVWAMDYTFSTGIKLIDILFG
ncbi:MAG: hypothetical protein ACRCZY_04650 [Phocaeicola sp.]